MTQVALLGLGAMGSRMAANLLKSGYPLTVWNRTPAATEALVKLGAVAAATPKAAATGADVVIVMVRDDDASRQVWLDPAQGALAGMKPGALAIDCSTLSFDGSRQLGASMQAHGTPFLDAPVSGSRPQADAAQLIFLVGGDAAVFARAEPLLKAMGSAVHHAGPVGSGALVKLATNTLLGVQVTALAELIGMLKHAGMDPARAMEIVSTTAVWSPYASRALPSMLKQDFQPQFPVDLVERDFGYALSAAGSDQSAPTIAAARQVFQAAKAKGLAEENLTSVVKLFTE